MKKIFIPMFMIFLAGCNNNEPRMLDIKRFLIAACFEDGIFTGTQDFGNTEDFITFCFFNYPSYCGPNGKNIIENELPRDKVGILRLCSMWLLNIAGDLTNKKYCEEQIDFLREEAKIPYEESASGYGYFKIPAITVTDAEIQDFYKKALKNRLAEMEIKGLGNVGSKQIKDFVYDYCIDNSPQNANMARKYIAQLSKNDPALSDAIDAFLIDLHPGLFELFTGKKYTPPNEIYPR
jgi:hypothetical protein